MLSLEQMAAAAECRKALRDAGEKLLQMSRADSKMTTREREELRNAAGLVRYAVQDLEMAMRASMEEIDDETGNN